MTGTFTTDARTVTADDVERFADLTGDHHPVHLDDDFAAGSIFGERIAHGLLVLSCGAGLAPLDPERVVALRRIDATFKAPVKLGDSVHLEVTMQESKPLDARHCLQAATWKVVNQDGATVIRARVELVCRTEPAAEPVGQATEGGRTW